MRTDQSSRPLIKKEKVRAQMIRVNHAGEFGAVQIYKGQLAILKDAPVRELLEEMLAHEHVHLARFEELIRTYRVRPTALSPLWRVAGYALGVGTALLGKEAAMACTEAVEDVIEKHYQEQLIFLEQDTREQEKEDPLAPLIRQCQQEEIAHHNIAIDEGSRQAPAYHLLTGAIKAATKAAIWLSKRI